MPVEKTPINLFVSNHGKQDGIEDYIDILQRMFEDSELKLVVSKKLDPSCTNIIIDEFTNFYQNNKIRTFREATPHTPLILIATEFIEGKHFVRSFNHFGNLTDSALIAMFNVFIRSKRSDFAPLRVADVASFLLLSPVLVPHFIADAALRFLTYIRPLNVLKKQSQKIKSRRHRLGYLHLRYIGFSKFIDNVDLIITSHEEIAPSVIRAGLIQRNNKRLAGVVYPVFNLNQVWQALSPKKTLGMEITGSVSPYRQRWINKCNRTIVFYGLNNTVRMVQARPFGAKRSEKLFPAAFSLHPPQTRNWPYSSPTRLFRALQQDGNIPILTHYFGQNPIEDICLHYKGVETLLDMCALFEKWSDDPQALRTFIEPRITSYNDLAEQRNKALVEKVTALAKRKVLET